MSDARERLERLGVQPPEESLTPEERKELEDGVRAEAEGGAERVGAVPGLAWRVPREDRCEATHPDLGYRCSRPVGHGGSHYLIFDADEAPVTWGKAGIDADGAPPEEGEVDAPTSGPAASRTNRPPACVDSSRPWPEEILMGRLPGIDRIWLANPGAAIEAGRGAEYQRYVPASLELAAEDRDELDRDLLAEFHDEQCAHGGTLNKLDRAQARAEELEEGLRQLQLIALEYYHGGARELRQQVTDEIDYLLSAQLGEEKEGD